MRWGAYRAGGFPARNLLFVVLLLAAALGLARPCLAVDLVDISRPLPQQDLSAFLAGLQTPEQTITIQRPGGGPGPEGQMTLTARGPGPAHNWVAASFTNTSKDPLSVVLAVPHQGFTGSGFYPPRLLGPRVYGTALAGDGQLGNLPPVPGENAYLLTLPAGGTASVAFEVTGGVLPVTLWQRAAFDAHKDFASFFRGALLGISVLIALAMLALYGFRARVLFPVAGGFALASIGFMLLEAGHLTALTAQFGMTGFTLQVLLSLIHI